MKLLFVIYGGGHVHMVYPVVHALRRSEAFLNGQLDLDVLALPAAGRTLRAHGIEPLGFRDFIDPLRDARALVWGDELALHHHSPNLGIPREDSVAYLGLCYADLVERMGEAEAVNLVRERGRQAFLPLTVMARIFEQLRPDFIVTSNSPRSEAAAIAVANERGIGSLAMTDLFTSRGGHFVRAQSVTFLNDTARQMFCADGLVDPRISEFHCTGNPAFDRILSRQREPAVGWMDRHFPGLGGRKAVLHADMPAWWDPVTRAPHFKSDAQTLAELDACYLAATANGAAYLVRPHPSQDIALFRVWLTGRKHAYLAADCDLHELLVNADLLLARATTVGLEAALLRRRILQLDAALHSDLPLVAMGVAWGSQGMDSLPVEVGQVLADDQGFLRILSQMDLTLPTEPAATKIADIILNKMRLPRGMRIGATKHSDINNAA